MQRKHNKDLTPRAKVLRKTMTPQERKLWYDFLRTFPVRVIRQKVIGRFIVDFYCSAANLAVEIDGSQHYGVAAQEEDTKRTKEIESFGVTTIRFSNRELSDNFSGVCTEIERCITERINR